MKAVRGKYQKGKIMLLEPAPEDGEGPVEVLVVFPDAADDPWRRILAEKTPRRAFQRCVRDCERQIAQGKSQPLDLDR